MQHNGIRLQQAGKKIEPIVTPRAAIMTARMSSSGKLIHGVFSFSPTRELCGMPEKSQRDLIHQPGVDRCNRITPGERTKMNSTLKGLHPGARDNDATPSGL